ncbi:hypothetical protein [Celerinatantimonas sp. MCCC 1A17872]|uniref:hypothetical protein n=1 Tax=Celerinatantimonas sp. MCCC 1A17872 TaxID=3177514 RepID=UPI0038BEA52E
MPLEFKVFIDDEDLPLYEKSKQSDALYEWEEMVPPIPPYSRWLVPAIAECFAFIVFLSIGGIDLIGISFILLTTPLLLFLGYGVIGADLHYQYRITPYGIESSYYQKAVKAVKAVYSINTFFCVIGIPVCIIAFLVMGPLAFVGAGGFALMAFKPPRPHGKIFFDTVDYDAEYVLFFHTKLNTLSLTAIPHDYHIEFEGYVGTQKEAIKTQLMSLFHVHGYYEVTNFEELYSHSAFPEAAHPRR